MSKRIYNVLFHTHTVSGLVISVALFVIFFAGSISFFRDDIINWERNQPIVAETQLDIDYNRLLDTLNARHELYGRDITIRQIHQERRVMVSMTPSADTTLESAQRRAFFYQDPQTQESHSYYEDFTLGEFIYRLHFFAQIPYPYGYLLSGFVAFFFLFAIVTGVIVHWKKIISNFYLFRPWAKLKTIWTDAHTALGLIGLPFQFMYAVTGATLIIGSTVMMSAATDFFYKGDSKEMYKDLSTGVAEFPFANEPTTYDLNLNQLVQQTKAEWPETRLWKVELRNYGDANMYLVVETKPYDEKQFVGLGQVAYEMKTGHVVFQNNPFENTNYITAANDVILKLHYGNFGSYGLKIIYFIFGIVGCFVILSGVLIWVEARDKKSNAPWKRKSNKWVAAIFMAISMSMYPVTSLSFVAVKLFKEADDAAPHLLIFKVFFLSWLALSILFSIKKDNFFTTKYSFLLGGVLGLIIPLTNGWISGNWLWTTFNEQQLQIFVVDVFWLSCGVISLLAVVKMKRKQKQQPSSISQPKLATQRSSSKRQKVL